MERFLICSNCHRDGNERFFKDVGPGFQLTNSMELCESLMNNEEDGPTNSHSLDRGQKALMGASKGLIPMRKNEVMETLRDILIGEIPKTHRPGEINRFKVNNMFCFVRFLC
jgi:hypothetical protein